MQSPSLLRPFRVSSKRKMAAPRLRHSAYRVLLFSVLICSTTAFQAAAPVTCHQIGSSFLLRSLVQAPPVASQQIHTTQLEMVKSRGGLEQRREGATPTGASKRLLAGSFVSGFSLISSARYGLCHRSRTADSH
jgi:hypothetical protein